MESLVFQEQLPVRDKSYDEIVTGLAAALTARRAGKQVLLIEKSTMLGGDWPRWGSSISLSPCATDGAPRSFSVWRRNSDAVRHGHCGRRLIHCRSMIVKRKSDSESVKTQTFK